MLKNFLFSLLLLFVSSNLFAQYNRVEFGELQNRYLLGEPIVVPVVTTTEDDYKIFYNYEDTESIVETISATGSNTFTMIATPVTSMGYFTSKWYDVNEWKTAGPSSSTFSIEYGDFVINKPDGTSKINYKKSFLIEVGVENPYINIGVWFIQDEDTTFKYYLAYDGNEIRNNDLFENETKLDKYSKEIQILFTVEKDLNQILGTTDVFEIDKEGVEEIVDSLEDEIISLQKEIADMNETKDFLEDEILKYLHQIDSLTVLNSELFAIIDSLNNVVPDTVICIKDETTGVIDEYFNTAITSISVSDGMVYVDTDGSSEYSFWIFDYTGKNFRAEKALYGTQEFPVDDLPTGAYIIFIETDSEKYIRKFIK